VLTSIDRTAEKPAGAAHSTFSAEAKKEEPTPQSQPAPANFYSVTSMNDVKSNSVAATS